MTDAVTNTTVVAESASSANWLLSIALAFGAIIAFAVLKKVLSGAAKVVLNGPRNKILLIGLAGAGKTVMFAHLCGGTEKLRNADKTKIGANNTSKNTCSSGASLLRLLKTQTSMAPNEGALMSGGGIVVDYPGHQRLRHGLFAELQQAKRLVIVVDSVTVTDDKTEGAKELAGMLLAVLQSHAFFGVETVLFACTKRDEVTSYSCKAVRRLLEAEMTRAITAQGGAIGALRGEIAQHVRKDAAARAAAAKEECLLSLDENNKFSFDSLSVPFSFVECSVDGYEAVESFCA